MMEELRSSYSITVSILLLFLQDLNCLNRDLSKVIIVDCNTAAFSMHPRNAIPLPKWTGNDNDKTLVDLASFLRSKDIQKIFSLWGASWGS